MIMWSISFIILIGIVLMVVDVPRIVRNKEMKELVFFITILLTGIVFNILNVLHVNIPSPVSLLHIVYGPISNWIEVIIG